jgi:hypothetical protein
MGEFKKEAGRDPEELNRNPSGGRKRGKWATRLGLTDPAARIAQLEAQDDKNANEVLRQYSMDVDLPTLHRSDGLPVEAADRVEQAIVDSKDIQKAYKNLPPVIQQNKK